MPTLFSAVITLYGWDASPIDTSLAMVGSRPYSEPAALYAVERQPWTDGRRPLLRSVEFAPALFLAGRTLSWWDASPIFGRFWGESGAGSFPTKNRRPGFCPAHPL